MSSPAGIPEPCLIPGHLYVSGPATSWTVVPLFFWTNHWQCLDLKTLAVGHRDIVTIMGKALHILLIEFLAIRIAPTRCAIVIMQIRFRDWVPVGG
jgi:hypothetical protein